MTELSQTILREYQIRKTKKQKDRFIALLQERFPQLQVLSGGFPKSRNLVVGDLERATVLLSAHYDTCARLPFPNFIMPKNAVLSILYSLLIVLPAVAAVTVFSMVLARYITDFWIAYLITLALYGAIILLMLTGPANRHNANDNTSGVITLLEIYQRLSPADREKVCLVFFDNEEKGVIGSGQFRRQFKKLLPQKLLVNFDCVSDGDHFLMGISKKANAKYRVGIMRAFTDSGDKKFLLEKLNRVYYPSDQAGFPVAIAVAALKRHRIFGYYMNRIHTKRDTVFDEGNINYLAERTAAFIQSL